MGTNRIWRTNLQRALASVGIPATSLGHPALKAPKRRPRPRQRRRARTHFGASFYEAARNLQTRPTRLPPTPTTPAPITRQRPSPLQETPLPGANGSASTTPSDDPPPSQSCGASRNPRASILPKLSPHWTPTPCPAFPQQAPSPKACSPPIARRKDCLQSAAGTTSRQSSPRRRPQPIEHVRALLRPKPTRPSPSPTLLKRVKTMQRRLQRHPHRPSPSPPPKTSSATPSTSSSSAAS